MTEKQPWEERFDNLSDAERARITELAQRNARLKKEAINIFRPRGYQDSIFRHNESELLIRGGNRSGKSVCAAMLVASTATGIPLKDSKGKEIPFYGPHAEAHSQNRPLTIWVIGLGEKHIGQTLHRLLFERGLFDMIKDEETLEWRAYDPDRDRHRKHECRPAPPAIPKRCIDPKGWGWKNKSTRLFEVCRLLNGTHIYAFTSVADAKMGDPVDMVWIDESIRFPKHYAEWQARLSDRSGRIIWSLWPGYSNFAVMKMHERANDPEDPDVAEEVLAFSDNPFIPADQKKKRLQGWSEDQRRSRDQGEFVEGATLIYPNFSKMLHSTTPPDHDMDEVDRILMRTGGLPPANWMRSLIVDPGHTHPGVLYVGTPPPALWNSVGGRVDVIFDEYYQPQSTADDMAESVKRNRGSFPYTYHIIDSHAGRKTPEGFAGTVKDRYESAWQKQGLRCSSTDGWFRNASDGILEGLMAVREALTIRPNGRPQLRVVVDRCPNFIRQMTSYRKGEDAHGYITEKPADRQIDPLCDCCRYWFLGDYEYDLPPQTVSEVGSAYEYYKSEWETKKSKESTVIYCGAGTPTS